MQDENSKVISNVYETNDYSRFCLMLGNRGTEKPRIAKIKESIRNYGFRMCPVVVNEKMEIVDGQGRFMALKELGLPIVYVVDKNADVNVCRALNINQKNWSLLDYIRSFSECGDNNDYSRLLNMIDRFYKLFPTRFIIGVCSHSAAGISYGRSSSHEIEGGGFKFFGKETSRASELEYLSRFLPVLKEVGGAYDFILGAILFAYRFTDVNREKLVSKFYDKKQKLYKVCDIKGALYLVTSVYNENLHGKNKVYVDHEYELKVTSSKDWQKETERFI